MEIVIGFWNMCPHRSRRKRTSSQNSRKWLYAVALLAIVAIAIGAYYMLSQSNPEEPSPGQSRVRLRTSMGDILIELREDMPITAGNFKKLVQEDTYDGTIFHRVIEGFMIQGGDPTGTGFGDPSIPTISDEFTNSNRNDRGTIAMANAGPNTGSSQFFINVVNNNYLDTKHPVFGKVIEGMDIVDSISRVATDASDRPIQEVSIIKAELVG